MIIKSTSSDTPIVRLGRQVTIKTDGLSITTDSPVYRLEIEIPLDNLWEKFLSETSNENRIQYTIDVNKYGFSVIIIKTHPSEVIWLGHWYNEWAEKNKESITQ